jgi:hypothetical protein
LTPEVLDWLLAGDPAIRWQVLRDLAGADEQRWREEQARVGREGWGVRLLDHQDPTGRWTPRVYGKKWLSTTYSMVLLQQLGLPGDDARAAMSCRLFRDEALSPDGGVDVTVSVSRSEACVSGMVLGLWSWFDVADLAGERERLVSYLLREQLADGGWNCQWPASATHSSFHSTINVLEGLTEYAGTGAPQARAASAAAARGREFLLVHRLFRSHRTGELVDARMLRAAFPPRWRYDVLRALDHFRAAGAAPDERAEEAVESMRARRRRDGRWLLPAAHPGSVWFEMELAGGPSRWNTLRALRVLDWWQSERADTV